MSRCLGLLCSLIALVLPATAAATHTPFATPLPIPQELTGADIEIDVAETPVSVLPGAATAMWTYDGSFPGPTIRRPKGAETRVTFNNGLEEAGALTIHRHGAEAASEHDGQPHDFEIEPGEAREYTYDLDERGAFEWYHDHRLDVTGRNLWNGLAGMFIIDDPAEDALNLPSGDRDVPLMFVDRSFDSENQLDYPDPVPFGTLGRSFPGTGAPPDDLFQGDHLLVNGIPQPHFAVQAQRYRLRLLNASSSKVLTFSLSDGSAMDQIATESGLLPAPVELTSVTLGPAERAEVIVDFGGREGEELLLQAGDGLTTEGAIRFAVADVDVPDPSEVKDVLSEVPALGESVRERRFDLSLAEEQAEAPDHQFWGINGKPFDPGRVDAQPKFGTTETWVIRGARRPHTIHVHGTDFEILSRNGVSPPLNERGLKETALVSAGETVRIRLRFAERKGIYVFHCHVVEHEDNGMMATYEVTDAGDEPEATPTPDPTPDPTATPTPEATDTSTDEPAPSATPDSGEAALTLSWVRTPKAIKARKSAKLRLQARSAGSLATVPASVKVDVPKGVAVKGAKKRRLKLALPALASGATKTFALKLTTSKRLPKRATFVARLAAQRATLTLRRSRNALRPAASSSLLCRFD